MIIIDRFEGNWAILETDTGMLEISRADLPPEAKEGDALEYMPDGTYSYVINNTATREREQRVKQLMQDIWEEGE